MAALREEEELIQAQLARIATSSSPNNQEFPVQSATISTPSSRSDFESSFSNSLNLSAKALSTWECKSCTLANSTGDDSCIVCGASRPAPTLPNYVSNGLQTQTSTAHSREGSRSNPSYYDYGASTNHPYPVPSRPVMTTNPSRAMAGQEVRPHSSQPFETSGASPGTAASGWACPHCTFFNESSDGDICSMCECPRCA